MIFNHRFNSEDINKKGLFPKFQLIPILCLQVMHNYVHQQWWHQNFFVGGTEGAKCISEGQKSKNLPKMADFYHFFSSDWGGKWGKSL